MSMNNLAMNANFSGVYTRLDKIELTANDIKAGIQRLVKLQEEQTRLLEEMLVCLRNPTQSEPHKH